MRITDETMRRLHETWREVLAIGRAQHGPIAARQAIAAGLARSSWNDRVRTEAWERPFRGVAVLPGCVVDATVRARAAALSLCPDATVTGWSALHLAGVTLDPPTRPTVVLSADRRSRTIPGVRVTRSRTLADVHRTRQAGVWVATVPRALLDAAANASRDRLRAWLIDARQRRLVAVDEVADLASAVASTSGRGRLLAACADVADSGADSVLVVEVESRLRDIGLHLDVPPRAVTVPGRVLHPDLTLCDLPIGIEVDGFGTHSSRRALDLDQRKHNAYALAGWLVLRISWARMADDGDGFVRELREAIRRMSG
jgi:hypothetical protein